MHIPTVPFSQDLVLIGGGHTHALVLRKWGMAPLPGVRLTLINPGPTAPYSGMLPGHLAGHYSRDALDIDLVKLARFANARLVLGAAEGLDLARRHIIVPGRPPIGFDIASLDIGITSAMPDLPGFAENATPAKPLGPFAARWHSFLQRSGTAAVAVIGGGVAGVEIALALSHALKDSDRCGTVTLIEKGHLLSSLRATPRNRLRDALHKNGVNILEGADIARIDEAGITLADGGHIPADFITGAAGARPQAWLAGTGLAQHDGFVVVNDKLQSSDNAVFAAGDCAHMAHAPRPKAGVFAVRQAPVLLENLKAALIGQGGFRSYRPQKDYLKLISLGARSALADRFGLCVSGKGLWRLKDRIDRKFMLQFKDLPRTPSPDLPWPRARGLTDALGPKPLCGGCGSKIGRPALMNALGQKSGAGDDAGILQTGSATQVISTDHLRAMVADPVTMVRLTAIHALGDIWAMGASAQAATLSVILPHQAEALAERGLSEIAQAARDEMARHGVEIVGGHSTFGAEMTLGFTVTGLCEAAPIALDGAAPGQSLILTKPVGSGVIMAAEMTGDAKGIWVEAALNHMLHPQAGAAKHLRTATAMTDVTGFGLAGHLLNICAASGVGAEISLTEVPVMDGAMTLAGQGIRSSLYKQNRGLLPAAPEGPMVDLLVDPQTCGGLLAAVPGDGQPELQALRQSGYPAVIIGKTTTRAAQMDIV